MQRKNTVFTFISEPPPTLGEAKVVQGEWNAKEKRSFYFHFRAAAYLGRSQSGARRVECKGKTQEMYERAGGASYFPCGAACVETRFIASHPLGAQPRLGILPSLWAIRAVRDAMNRVSTWRISHAGGGMLPRGRRPRRGRAMSSLGWSAAEPEVGRMVRKSASKRSLCRCGLWHRRLFEAIFVMCSLSAGSATLHPRLRIARPPWGRSCCEGPMMRSGSVSERQDVRLRRDAIHRVSPARGVAPPRHSSLASGHPGGERRDESRLYVADFPCGWRGVFRPRGCRPHRGRTIDNRG